MATYSAEQTTQGKDENSGDLPSATSTARATWVIAGSTIISLIVAIVSAGIAYFQWSELHSGSDDTHRLAQAAVNQAKTLEYADRAHVSFIEADIKDIQNDGRSINAIFFNGGNTQTSSLFIKGTCNSAEPTKWPDLRNGYHWILAAKSRVTVDLCPMTKEDVSAHDRDNRPNYLFGEATYNSIGPIGNIAHITRFCVVIDNAAVESKNIVGTSMTPCSRFNCADEECHRDGNE